MRGGLRDLAISTAFPDALRKLTAPGVPDIYQGNEIWDWSLVDPDNRRPVDFAIRQRLLEEVQSWSAENLSAALASIEDGRIKLHVIWAALQVRTAREKLFREGSYIPLKVSGERAAHLLAYARKLGDEVAIIAMPRLYVRLLSEKHRSPHGADVWGDTRIELPKKIAGVSFENAMNRKYCPRFSRRAMSACSPRPPCSPTSPSRYSAISAGLQRKEMRVAPVELHQLFVAAHLDDAAAVEHGDLIRHAHRREAMRDQDGDAVSRELAEALEDVGFGAAHPSPRWAHRARRCRRRVRMKARDSAIFCHWPPESSRPSLNHLPSCVSDTVCGMRLDEVARLPLHGRFLPASPGHRKLRLVAGANVLAHQQLVADEVLEDHADPRAQRVPRPIPSRSRPSSRMRPVVGS